MAAAMSLLLPFILAYTAFGGHVAPGNGHIVRHATETDDSVPAGPTNTGTASNCNQWYTVVEGDSCYSIEQEFNITHENFLKWNPAVSEDCKANFWPTYSYCVGVGGKVSSSAPVSSTSTSAVSSSEMTSSATTNATFSTRYPITSHNITTIPVETAWPPTRTQAGQPTYCNKWYLVQGGDTCASIHILHHNSMTKAELLEWNPTLGDDCSGLYLGWWVCVGVRSQSSLTLAYPTAGETSVSVPEATSHTPRTISTDTESFTASPTQDGIAPDCTGFYHAQDGDTCSKVLSQFGYITEGELYEWNPALGDDCSGLTPNYYYCIAAFQGLPMPPTVTAKPSPTQSGIAEDCVSWYQMKLSDTCDSIVAMFGTFSRKDFISWNPRVWGSCSNIKKNYWYCVAVPGTPTTRTSSISTTSFPTNIPIQSGVPVDCNSYWLVSKSDTCESIASRSGISLDTFFSWNPTVGSSSCDNLLPNYRVCVGVDSSSTSGSSTGTATYTETTITPAPSTTSAETGGVSTPTPTQADMVDGCHRFYFVHNGDGCWDIAANNEIDLEDFYSWNPAVKDDCSRLWPDYYVCIGISGPGITLTSPYPKPTET